jgi:hypothetical protein
MLLLVKWSSMLLLGQQVGRPPAAKPAPCRTEACSPRTNDEDETSVSYANALLKQTHGFHDCQKTPPANPLRAMRYGSSGIGRGVEKF